MRNVRLFALSLLIAVTAAVGAIGATTALTEKTSVVADDTHLVTARATTANTWVQVLRLDLVNA